MNRTIEGLISYAKEVLTRDGLTEDYIIQLSHTWNAFERYIYETGMELTSKSGVIFLHEHYGVAPDASYFSLSGINRRRKRAISVLINCMEHDAASKPKTYLLSRYDRRYESVLSDFIAYRSSQGISLKTVNLDIHCLNKLSDYLVSIKLDSLAELDSHHLVGFMKWLSQASQLPTMRKAVSTLRLLCNYLYDTGMHRENLFEYVPRVKVKPDRIPSVYKTEQIQKMLDTFNRSSKVGLRDYAMVLLAARLGMRASDISALLFESLNWHNNTIEFNTIKTSKHTILPLTEEVGGAIIEYLRYGRPETKDKHVFIRLQKPYKELQPSVLHKVVTTAMRNAGIVIEPGKRHGPHALRASLASEMLANNTPLPVISETLSHANTDTTRIYLKIDITHLRELSLGVPPLGNIWMGGAPI